MNERDDYADKDLPPPRLRFIEATAYLLVTLGCVVVFLWLVWYGLRTGAPAGL
jgi:hypothetical protein